MKTTLFKNVRVRSWPYDTTEMYNGKKKTPSPIGDVVDLSVALNKPHPTDMHFTAYAPFKNGMRLNLHSVASQAHLVSTNRFPTSIMRDSFVEMQLAIFDCDDPIAHEKGEAASPEWRSVFRDRVKEMASIQPGLFMYETRGGGRLIWSFEKNCKIRTIKDSKQWSRIYYAFCDYIQESSGVIPDRACNDWTRLFRLPKSTRIGNYHYEDYPTIGNPKDIGPLVIPNFEKWLLEVPLELGQVRVIEKERKHPATERNWASMTDPQLGLFATMLRNRGDLGHEISAGKWACRCPSRLGGEHGLRGDTVVMAPTEPGGAGWIHCSHNRCQPWQKNIAAMFGLFSRHEIDSVRGKFPGVIK